MASVSYAHIELSGGGVPMIGGTQIKVVELALDHLAYQWDAAQIHAAHPNLSLGQIHSALAYYYDHKTELDADIERRREKIDQLGQSIGPSAIAQKLRQLGKLP